MRTITLINLQTLIELTIITYPFFDYLTKSLFTTQRLMVQHFWNFIIWSFCNSSFKHASPISAICIRLLANHLIWKGVVATEIEC